MNELPDKIPGNIPFILARQDMQYAHLLEFDGGERAQGDVDDLTVQQGRHQ